MADKDVFDIEMNKDITKKIIQGINRYYGTLTITRVEGTCPYGHREGESHTVTPMNHDGLCGALWHVIQPSVMSLLNGGRSAWEKEPGLFTGICPEMGRVQVKIKCDVKEDGKVLRTKPDVRDMTGKGFVGLDKYRLYLEILDVGRHCLWAHRPGQKIEIDTFNIGRTCGNLYWGTYHFIELLLAGGSVPWEADPHIIHNACPDVYNQTAYRLIREER